MSRAERRAMVERGNPVLPVFQQCRLLAVARSAVYRKPAEVSTEDLAIMALIDRQYLVRPYYGSPPKGGGVGPPRPPSQSKTVPAPRDPLGPVAPFHPPP